jgi:hypothetical protein
MENILIENDKLTPDIKLCISGTTMMFRKDYGDREFIRKENADVIIEAPMPELQAKLIEGKWYWVNDCPECNGKEAEWAYAKCEKHNVCVDCGIKRKDVLDTTVWGHSKGFRCNTCQITLNEQVRTEALQKVAEKEYDEWDYHYTDKLLCPHCGTDQNHEMVDGEPSDENECEVCWGKFSTETHYTVEFSTTVIGERITLEK